MDTETDEIRDVRQIFLGTGVLVALVLAAAALILASSGGTASPEVAAPADSAGAAGQTVEIIATEWAYEPAEVELAAGTHTVRLVNDGEVVHDITFADGTTVEAAPGETAEVEVTIPAGGTEFYCSIPGHRDAGMEGQVTTAGTGDTQAEDAAPSQAEATTAAAKTPGVEEISRHPTDLPAHADYGLYRDGQYQDEIQRDGPITQEVHFEIVETAAEVLPGTTVDYWTFDGTVPGPMLRARVGDTIDFHLHNPDDSSMPHNVDFHAVTGPGGGATALDAAPGATSNLRVELLSPGIYIYHCAFPDVPTHIAHGMYGLIVVEPEGGLPEVDHEFYVLQSELYTDRGGSRSTAQLEEAGHLAFSGEFGNLEEPTFVTFNGRPGAVMDERALGVFGDSPISTGDTARLYVGNIGPNLISSFHVIGEIFDTVYVEGSFDLTNHNVQSTLVPSGGATGVEMTFEVPGDYLMVDHAIFRVHKGAAGVIRVGGEGTPGVFEPVTSSDVRGGDGH